MEMPEVIAAMELQKPSRSELKVVCPLNFECPQRMCPNRACCENYAIAWELPYQRTSEGLVVKPVAYRTRWQKQARNSTLGEDMPFCPLPSGDYAVLWDRNPHEIEVRQRILSAWYEAGWAAALSIPNIEKITDKQSEESSIPF